VRGDVAVSLLETVVLLDVVQVVAANDDGALHLRGVHNALQNAAADADVASERALLVDVGALNGLLGGLEAQTDVAAQRETRMSSHTRKLAAAHR
jgi:hypothetical protein